MLGAGMPLGGYQSPSGRTRRLAREREPVEALVPATRARPLAVGAVEHHERVGLRLVRLLLLDVGDADDLVAAVAVEVADRRRRGRPLQPRRLVHVGPVAGVPVVVVVLDLGPEPADELAPAEAAPDMAALAVRVPGRREHRRAVVVEEVDLVVVEGDDDLALRVVVELPDPDVLPVGPVAVVADAVEGASAALYRGQPGAWRRAVKTKTCEPRPCWWSWRPPRCDRRRRGRPPRGRGSPGTGRRCRSRRASRPWAQPAGAEVVGRHGAVVAADDDLLHAVAVEVGDHAGRVDPALARRPLAQEPALRAVDERAVEGRDDLELLVAGEIDEPGRREPTRLPGVDVPHEARLRHRRARGVGRRQRHEQDECHPPPHGTHPTGVVPAHSAAQQRAGSVATP